MAGTNGSPDIGAIWTSVAGALHRFIRGLEVGARVRATRLGLARSAAQLPYPPLRNALTSWLTPRALPIETGDAFGGVDGQLRVSGAHAQISGEHSGPVPRSGEHGALSSPGGGAHGGSGPRKRVPRPGATFTPAKQQPPAIGGSLTGGAKKLTPDEVEAIKHDSVRRKAEAKARAVVDKHREKFGKFKLEKLGALPRTFSPDALAAFRAQFPEVDAATVQLLTPVIAGASRDVCDRAAVFLRWSEADRLQFVSAFAPATREKWKPAFEALDRLPAAARQALLRLPRAPVAANLEALTAKWTGLPKDDIQNVALALAHFDGPALQRVISAAAPPVKIAPQGIRG